jgi:hypothetical protein
MSERLTSTQDWAEERRSSSNQGADRQPAANRAMQTWCVPQPSVQLELNPRDHSGCHQHHVVVFDFLPGRIKRDCGEFV